MTTFGIIIICVVLIFVSSKALADEPSWLRWLVYIGLVLVIVIAALHGAGFVR